MDDDNVWNAPYAMRCYFFIAFVATRRSRMSFLFTFYEVNMIASGISYKAKTETEAENFNSIRVIYNRRLLFTGDWMEIMRVWNSQVQTWLRHYVTTPMIDKSLPKDTIQVIPIAGTLIICGAWHGFYIGYQMMFMSSALFAIALKFWYRT